ncbi:MAG: hypothetical protein ACPLZF_05805 [Nitrososphaeria archaeon]
MIFPVVVNNGTINLPKKLLDLYNIEDKKILILVPTEQGILIRPTQAKSEENMLINSKQSLENEIDAIIAELSYSEKVEAAKVF